MDTRSDEFRTWWARHDVRFHMSGVKRFRHPLVGELTLGYERLELPVDPGLGIVTYSAEPGSASEEALRELRRWIEQRQRVAAGHRDRVAEVGQASGRPTWMGATGDPHLPDAS